ncbi:Asp23/Gls24 family envelope stress response protein [Actinomadura kijaniata]|uniref:Asp23/Gls24 family envelope stress response protein n=1 Tax=Actinomadura kijaniata TaxID=46161 RepID=UPI003F1C017E
MTAVVAGGRGVTRISDRVVARIAEHVADAADDTGGVGRSVLGVPVGGRRTRTDIEVHGDHVIARVELAVAYPEPVREVTRRVRDEVRARVHELTGLTVGRVDIDVTVLEVPRQPGPRREPPRREEEG